MRTDKVCRSPIISSVLTCNPLTLYPQPQPMYGAGWGAQYCSLQSTDQLWCMFICVARPSQPPSLLTGLLCLRTADQEWVARERGWLTHWLWSFCVCFWRPMQMGPNHVHMLCSFRDTYLITCFSKFKIILLLSLRLFNKAIRNSIWIPMDLYFTFFFFVEQTTSKCSAHWQFSLCDSSLVCSCSPPPVFLRGGIVIVRETN